MDRGQLHGKLVGTWRVEWLRRKSDAAVASHLSFCEEQGNFALAHHAEKKKASSSKKLNFDLYQCKNCMAYVHVFWSAMEGTATYPVHDFRVLPWPLGKAKASDNWPPDVQRYWTQADESLGIKNWDAAAVMARSAVQVAMRHKGAVEGNLYTEIEGLAAKGDLPPLMKRVVA